MKKLLVIALSLIGTYLVAQPVGGGTVGVPISTGNQLIGTNNMDANTAYLISLIGSGYDKYSWLTPFTNIVSVNMTNPSYPPTIGFVTGTNEAAINIGGYGRCRQEGFVDHYELTLSGPTNNLTGFYIEWWRDNGAGTWVRTFKSENLFGSIANTTNIIYLRTNYYAYIGDYPSVRWTASAAVDSHLLAVINNGAIAYTENIDPNAAVVTNFNWTAQHAALSPFSIPLKVFMQSPSMLAIGDSLVQGAASEISFLDDTSTATNAYFTTWPYTVAKSLGVTYQNWGRSSLRSDQILNVYTNIGLNTPHKFLIGSAGLNDIGQDFTNVNTFINNITNIWSYAAKSNINVLWTEIVPFNNIDTAHKAWAALFNTNLRSAVLLFTNVTLCSIEKRVGQYASDGPPFNLWNCKPQYDAGVSVSHHYNPDGYYQWALANLEVFITAHSPFSPKYSRNTIPFLTVAPSPCDIGPHGGMFWFSNSFLYLSYTPDGVTSNTPILK